MTPVSDPTLNLELPDFRGEPADVLTKSFDVGHACGCLGADTTQVAVPSGTIVENIDVVGDVCQRDLAARIDPLLEAFLLQAAEERFRHRVDSPMSSTAPGSLGRLR